MKNRAGYTLIEIMIASAMALLVLGALIRIFWFGRNVEREARSSYLIRQDVDVAFRNLQDELRLTHLAGIRVASDNSSFSMPTPIENNDFQTFELTDYAVAGWKKWAHFTVTGDNENTGTLVRWEAPFPAQTNLGVPSSLDPTQVGDKKWALLKGVVKPGRGAVPGKDAERLPKLDAMPDNSGLQLRFLRYENGRELLSTTNPAQSDDAKQPGWSRGTTQLVDCRLQVADESTESGKLSLYTLQFRVKPRN